MGWLRSEGAGSDAWSVSEITGYIKELFDIDYRLNDVTVEGEISNFTRARSGHLYFTLKDSAAQLRCVMWRSSAGRLVFDPADGDAVVAQGRVSVYEAGGAYQLYVDRLQPAGRGALAEAFEALKTRLEAEGLFEPEGKQPIPGAPRKIGIVTSANAAALRDILNVLRRRYPLVQVLIAPTLVQGADAPPQIVRALQWLDGRDDVETIIVSRGGGSLEDLWAFNDERVARAIFAARHPIISGVGHETDFTIADFVADLRAPTPSAAAELAVPDLGELQAALVGLTGALEAAVLRRMEAQRSTLAALARTLRQLGPTGRMDNARQRLDTLALRLERQQARYLEQQAGEVRLLSSRLASLGPLATLARGYAIVRDERGRVLRRSDETETGRRLDVRLAHGRLGVTVEDVAEDA